MNEKGIRMNHLVVALLCWAIVLKLPLTSEINWVINIAAIIIALAFTSSAFHNYAV